MLNPARQLRIDQWVGSLEVGKRRRSRGLVGPQARRSRAAKRDCGRRSLCPHRDGRTSCGPRPDHEIGVFADFERADPLVDAQLPGGVEHHEIQRFFGRNAAVFDSPWPLRD